MFLFFCNEGWTYEVIYLPKIGMIRLVCASGAIFRGSASKEIRSSYMRLYPRAWKSIGLKILVSSCCSKGESDFPVRWQIWHWWPIVKPSLVGLGLSSCSMSISSSLAPATWWSRVAKLCGCAVFMSLCSATILDSKDARSPGSQYDEALQFINSKMFQVIISFLL